MIRGGVQLIRDSPTSILFDCTCVCVCICVCVCVRCNLMYRPRSYKGSTVIVHLYVPASALEKWRRFRVLGMPTLVSTLARLRRVKRFNTV